ncbi:MFS transporter [Nonomuraea sp. NPDC050556]|uniref:MFS transporter n=1 Tax=Nonomuraea sp. NPDC050556 TaxID=3364369 RepID=UPI0037A7ADDA
MYAYTFFEDFVLFYPVYALLFASTGLSPGEISSLLVIWSVAGFALEVPTGLLADVFSRRLLLVLSPLVVGLGYGLWTFFPSYPAFAAGFVLWGAGTAMRSGTLQAQVYESLPDKTVYARLMGRSQVAGMLAMMAGGAVAGPVLAAGGFLAVGVASVAATVVTALIGTTFPDAQKQDPEEEEESFLGVLRVGLGEVRRVRAVRFALLAAVVIGGFTAIDEYLPLLAQGTGVGDAAVPLLLLVISLGQAVGGWLAGRGAKAVGPLLVVAGVLLAGGAATGSPFGFLPIAVAFGIFQWGGVAADARLQDRIEDRSRATVTSLAGLGTEVVALAVYAFYGVGSTWLAMGVLFALSGLPYLVIGLTLAASGLRRRRWRAPPPPADTSGS